MFKVKDFCRLGRSIEERLYGNGQRYKNRLSCNRQLLQNSRSKNQSIVHQKEIRETNNNEPFVVNANGSNSKRRYFDLQENMANENNKIKLLLLWDILSKNTDENHAMNADEIREELAT